MISTLIFMAAGMFIGAKLFPPKLQKYNSILQQVCVFLLIFSMGVSLGSGPTFWEDLKTVGWESVVFALATIAGSILFVWMFTRKLPHPGGRAGGSGRAPGTRSRAGASAGTGRGRRGAGGGIDRTAVHAGEMRGSFSSECRRWGEESAMTILIAVVCLAAGIFCGQCIPQSAAGLIDNTSDVLLNLLLLSVGITVGANKLIFRKLKEFNLKVLYIPLGIIAGSLMFGTAAGMLMGLKLNTAAAISSGLGWYSLSGIMMKDLAGAQIGTMTFLSNIFREIFSFILIPLIATRFGPYTAIAPAAATSEDTTLPILMKYTSEEVAVIAVINGVLCSTAVPVLVSFTFKALA